MPSSKSSSSSRSSNSRSSNSSSSKSMTKDNYYALVFIALIAILFAIYYFTYKSNNEPFSSRKKNGGSNSNSSGSPNLTPSQGETVVALFYADWCPHCVAFKPDFMKAKTDMNGKKSKGKNLRLELVDCVANKSIASENDVSGFPTVKIFTDDNNSTEYSGERSYEGLTSYLK